MGAREILIKFLGETTGIKASATEVEGSMKKVEGATGSAGGAISALGTSAEKDLGKVEGASGKVGGAIGDLVGKVPGLGSAFGGIKGVAEEASGTAEKAGGGLTGMGLGAAAAGLAIGDFALHAVEKFTSTAIAAGDAATATGLTVDQASRWIAVAPQHGVAFDTVESAIARMNKTVGASPAKLEALGGSVVYAKDGSVDANATFLGLIDTLNGMTDPAKKAELGTAAFGKGWKSMADLIAAGSPDLKKNLADVAPSMVFSEKDVKSAKDVRDGFNSIEEAGKSLMLAIGKALAPVVAALAPELGKVLAAVTPLVGMVGTQLAGAFRTLSPLIAGATTVFGAFTKSVETWSGIGKKAADDITQVMSQHSSELDQIAEKQRDANVQLTGTVTDTAAAHMHLADVMGLNSKLLAGLTLATQADTQEANNNKVVHDAVTQARAEETQADQDTTKALQDNIKALTDDQKAEESLVTAMRSATDATFAVDAKTVDYKTSLDDLSKQLDAAKGDQDKVKVAYDNNTTAAAALADAQVKLRTDTDSANGVVTSAKDKQDAWNAAMVSASQQANGPARDAIAAYITSVNGIPTDKATQITAAIAAGDIDTANQLLADASRARTASIKVDVDGQSIAKANADIQNGIDRNLVLNVTPKGPGVSGPVATARAGGGPVKAGQVYMVGENHPELFVADQDGYIDPRDPTQPHGPTSGGYGGGVTIHIHGDITDGVQAKLDRFAADIAARLQAGRRN